MYAVHTLPLSCFHQGDLHVDRTDTKACSLGNSLWTRHEGLATVAHEIFNWCRSKHGHTSPTRASPRTKKRSANDTSSLTTYRHVPSLPQPKIQRKPQGPYSMRARTRGTIVRESKTWHKVSSSRSAAGPLSRCTAGSSASSDAKASSGAKARPLTASPAPPVDRLVGYIATSQGDIFRTDAEAGDTVKDPRVQMKMFRDLTSAGRWFMSLPAPNGGEQSEEASKASHAVSALYSALCYETNAAAAKARVGELLMLRAAAPA
ncbi:hypothetical protein B0H16DRAFT_1716186 [Mycena metata]|uniref:Uncharacterized protein n=1 Tax=Mycena metata TaxID=1033252 RepID=A0AAD7NP12_9AGAR|nr:hypothetical protein B0H16DRAFT_1716186 [Mycena metata]